MIINNVTRLLDSRKIPYQAFELPVEKLGAADVADILGVKPNLVYKSIVVLRETKGKPILAVVSGTAEVDLKELAKFLGEKKILLPTEREAERVSGLQAGGISPLALLNKGFQIILDQSARSLDEIYISGGQRGLNIRLPVKSFIELTHCQVAPIVRSL